MKPLIERCQVSCVELRTHLILGKFRGAGVDTADTGGVLCGECCDDTCPTAVQRGEYLQVHLKQAQESVNPPKVPGESRADLDPSTS